MGSALALAASLSLHFALVPPGDSTPEEPRQAAVFDFEEVSAEELAVALEPETIQDLPVIANLELLERFVALEEKASCCGGFGPSR